MEFCSARFIPARWNFERNRRMETESSRRLSKALSEFYWVCWKHQLYLKESNLSLIYNRYDYCFKACTHSYKFFSGIINIYNPTSVMCSFWLLLPKNHFLKGGRETLPPIWDFSYTFLFPKIPSLKSLR